MHTPGPWTLDPETGVVFDSSGAKAIQTGGFLCDEETKANARLIAAAPELFELAKLCREIVDDDLENRPARHSLGNLHARLKTIIRNVETPIS